MHAKGHARKGAMQAKGPEFGPPEPTLRKLGMVICACNLKVCEIRDRQITGMC